MILDIRTLANVSPQKSHHHHCYCCLLVTKWRLCDDIYRQLSHIMGMGWSWRMQIQLMLSFTLLYSSMLYGWTIGKLCFMNIYIWNDITKCGFKRLLETHPVSWSLHHLWVSSVLWIFIKISILNSSICFVSLWISSFVILL